MFDYSYYVHEALCKHLGLPFETRYYLGEHDKVFEENPWLYDEARDAFDKDVLGAIANDPSYLLARMNALAMNPSDSTEEMGGCPADFTPVAEKCYDNFDLVDIGYINILKCHFKCENKPLKYRGVHDIHGSRIAFMEVSALWLFHDIGNACWYKTCSRRM